MTNKGDILVVDDAQTSLKLVTKILTKEGYQVHSVDSGELALSFVAAKLPDLILLDIRMPGMDGFEVFRKLKAQKNTCDIPIIFLSASVGMDERVKGLRLGAVDFVFKPFQSEELLARVHTHVELRRLRVRLEQQAVELQQSEQQYRSLFENMREGFAYCKMLYDEKNQPVDFIYLDVNQAFEQLTGLKNVVGKPVSEVIPGIREISPELFESYGRVASTGKPERFEFDLKSLNQWLSISVYSPEVGFFVAVFDNISERKHTEEQIQRNESRLKSLVNILQYNAKTTQEFLDYALNEAIKLTESKIGYIYFYHEDRKQFVLNTWSKDVMKECSVASPQTCYELDRTGIWGEAVRQRRAIILNDFQEDHPLKKGYPEGHAHLTKFMTVPIFKKNQIVAVVGVANKVSNYDETDVLQLSLLMDNVWNVVDIKRTEEELRKLSRAVEQSPASIVITDTTGAIEYVNPKFVQITGYSGEEVIGKNPRVLKTGETPPEEYTKLWNTITSGNEWRGEFHNKRKNGELYWESAVISPIIDTQGDISHFLAVKEDITVHKKAEEALLRSSEMVQLLLNSTAEAIYGLDMNGLCTFNNTACLNILGYEHTEQLLGRNMHEVIHSKYADGTPYDVKDCPIFKAFRNGQEIHIENEVLWRRGGTSFFAEYWSYPVRQDGKLIGAVVTFIDITERKKAEAVLASERRRLSYILEGTNVGTWEWNIQTGETIYNERWAQIIGYTLHELAPVSIKTWEKLAHPDDFKKTSDLLKKHFNKEIKYYECETRMLHKNGSWVWVLDRGKVATWTHDGKPLTMSGTHQDITERKQADQALQEAARERENLIRELQYALDNIKTLQGLIPICANCKKIRDDKGFWNQVEGYISEHTGAEFTHGICPDCAKKLYGDLYEKALKKPI